MRIVLVSALILVTAAAAPAPVPVNAPGPLAPLSGTFQPALQGPVPAGAEPAPLVLILPGSGPTDRDGNSPLGIRAAPYRLLAEALAAQGIASVRIDKRGLAGSAAAGDGNAVTLDDYVHDTRSWIRASQARTAQHCLWLLGHSEGGLVALATASRNPAGICGLILVATPGRPLAELLRAQLRANPANAPLLADADRAIDSLQAGHRIDTATLPAALRPLFAPQVQGFLCSVFPVDPAWLLAGIHRPVLILQGLRDLQVCRVDAERLAAASPSATLRLLPDTSHVLKTVSSDDRAGNLATYADPDRPLAPGVADSVSRFIRSHARPPG